MVFSLNKWDKGREFQHVMKSSAAVDFNSFEPILREAFDLVYPAGPGGRYDQKTY